MKLDKVKQSIPALMLVIIISKVIGMLREIVLANYFGTSYISDAYLIASSVPTLLFYFIGHSISTAYIPIYNKTKNDGGQSKGLKYTNSILNISFIICTALVILILSFPIAVIKLFAFGFNGETVTLTVSFIRISAVSMYLMIIINVLSGYLQANKSFIMPAAISLPRNTVVIVSIVIAAIFGVQWLGIGLLLAYIAECAFLLPFAFTKGYRYRPVLGFRDSYVKETWYVIVPILVGMFVSQINKMVDRSLASSVCEGGVSALTYASVINNAVQEILVTGIITVLFSHCAEWVVKNNHEKVKQKLASTLNTLIMLLLPATIGVMLLAKPIVLLVLGRGKFDDVSTTMTVGALCCYTSGLTFLAIRDTLVKVFYAYKKTKATTTVAIVAITINIIFNLILYKIIGLNGLAIATTVSAVFHSIVLYVLLRKQIGDFGLKSTAIVSAKSAISCVIMACIIYGVNYITSPLNDMLSLTLCVIAGMVTYFAIASMLKIEPMIVFLKKLKNFKNTIL